MDTFNISNTTNGLLKFHLQEEHRSTMNKLQNQNRATSNEYTHVYQDSLNALLQTRLDRGSLFMSSLPSLTSAFTDPDPEDEEEIDDDDEEEGGGEQNSLDRFLSRESKDPNFLNLKILIENSLLDASRLEENSIMSLGHLELVKKSILEKSELQHYLYTKLNLAHEFVKSVLLPSDSTPSSDSSRAMSMIISLQEQLGQTTAELEDLQQKLNDHNLSCLLLGYIDDVRRHQKANELNELNESASPTSPERLQLQSQLQQQQSLTSAPLDSNSQANAKVFDALFGHVASVAAQRGATLPIPDRALTTTDVQIGWLQSCIDAVLASEASTSDAPSASAELSAVADDCEIKLTEAETFRSESEYKTALADLRFSYEYLAKEYEMSRISTSKLIQTYRRKIESLESQNKLGYRANQSSSTVDLLSPSHDKDQEISRLRRELNLLKVNKTGSSTPPDTGGASTLVSSSTNQAEHSTNISPVTRAGLGAPFSSLNVSPSDEQDGSWSSSPTKAVSSRGVSNDILRKEFKKIVNELQDQYEMDLTEERLKRKKLEEELARLKESSS
ncbi:uncharacterized protein LODBEIA_P43860 [Lodderomyces beijingensis]|uniref:Up-regulated during septation protein 1 domain-containing protein n=1 Tax=Lodderomyces beijingensis TaxID=1775926 RepID=A0ABP0ZS33_9ASCO